MRLTSSARADAPAFLPDIPYTTIDGVDLKLDVAMPAGPGPFPLVLCLHGGGWATGDKSKFDDFTKELAAHGYVAATINYRFAPKYKFPAQLDDARAALRFLKGHAADYRIDPAHVAAAGESAGAQIALLLGFMDDPQKGPADCSTRVQCVLNYFGPTDFTHWVVTPLQEILAKKMLHKSIAEVTTELFGTSDLSSPPMIAASPITFVTASAPPVLTLHGTLDPIVSYHQAELLHEALRKVGVAEKLIPVSGAHGRWLPNIKAEADKAAVAWLDQYLKGEPVKAPNANARVTKFDGAGRASNEGVRTTNQ